MSNWFGWIALQQMREHGGKWRVIHHTGYVAASFDDEASAKTEADRLNGQSRDQMPGIPE